MNVTFNYLYSQTFEFINNRILSSRERTICLLVSCVLASLAACFGIQRYCKSQITAVKAPEAEVDDLLLEETETTFSGEPKEAETLPEKSLSTEISTESFPPKIAILPTYGKVRKGGGIGKLAQFTGEEIFGKEIIVKGATMAVAGFACCFHTTQSHKEIYDALKEICLRDDPDVRYVRHPDEYVSRLQKNLSNLHQALPGESTKKQVKIYWNEQAQKILLPFMFANDDVDAEIDGLLFAVVPGESIKSRFQGSTLDFSHQIQFVGLNRTEAIKQLRLECRQLSKEILGQSVFRFSEFKPIATKIYQEFFPDNPLCQSAYYFTLLNNIKANLIELKTKKQKIDPQTMKPEEVTTFFANLLASKRT